MIVKTRLQNWSKQYGPVSSMKFGMLDQSKRYFKKCIFNRLLAKIAYFLKNK